MLQTENFINVKVIPHTLAQLQHILAIKRLVIKCETIKKIYVRRASTC